MTKKDLVRLIREVVKREVKSVINEEINSALTLLEEKKTAPKSMSLNEAINQTRQENAQDEFAPYPEIDANSLRAKFAGMQGVPQSTAPMVDINNKPVKNVTQDLEKALTRNYSDLVKRF